MRQVGAAVRPSREVVGREREWVALGGLLEDVRAGRPRGLSLAGPAGIGKSTLVEALGDAASDFTVLRGRGVQSEQELPYAGLHQLVRPLLPFADRLPEAQKISLECALGARLGEVQAFAVSLAVLGILAEAAEERPVLCLVDDVQWTDESSLSALLFALRRFQSERVGLVLARRSEPGQPDPVREPGLDRVELQPLSEEAERRLLRARSGTEVGSDVAQRIRHATGGYPLATLEIARLLTADQLSGRSPLPVPLPVGSSVQQLYESTVRRLDEIAQRMMLVVAADDAGVPGVLWRAGELVGADSSSLSRAEQAGLVAVAAGSVEFTHPLVRSAVYATASSDERRAAHRALADAYAEEGDTDRSVWHRALAAVKPDPAAAEALAGLARRSHRRSAHASASSAFEMAAALSGPEREAELLVEAARCAWSAGLLERGLRLAERAELVAGTSIRPGEVAAVKGTINLGMGRPRSGFELFLAAAEEAAPHDPDRALDALNLASECIGFTADPVAARRLGEMVTRLEPSLTDDRRRFLGEALLGVAELFGGDPFAGIRHFRQALCRLSAIEEPELLATAGRAATYVGEDDLSRSLNTRAVDRATAGGTVGAVVIAGSRVGLFDVLGGRFASALASGEAMIRLANDTGRPRLATPCYFHSALVAGYRGDESLCRQLLDGMRTAMDPSQVEGAAGPLAWAEAALRLSIGDHEAAHALFRGIQNPIIRIQSAFDALEAAVLVDDPSAIQALRDLIAGYADVSPAEWARARVEYSRALLAQDDAQEHFEAAVALARRSPRRFEAGRIELAYGRWLRRRRRRVEARKVLRSAFATFETMGATPWMERAEGELRATGETPRKRTDLTYDRLTPQELQVARHVSEGASNREVAARLFISHRTVDYHLRNVFTKLGISSRTELARLRLDDSV